VGRVVGGRIVGDTRGLVGVTRTSVGTVVCQVYLVPSPILGYWGGERLECSGITGVGSPHVQVLYFVARVVGNSRSKWGEPVFVSW